MNDATRRGFLVTAGAGAAAAGVAAVAPSADAAGGSVRHAEVPRPATAHGPLVAHVEDVHGETISLLVGEREVVVRDPDLVARLARAAWEG